MILIIRSSRLISTPSVVRCFPLPQSVVYFTCRTFLGKVFLLFFLELFLSDCSLQLQHRDLGQDALAHHFAELHISHTIDSIERNPQLRVSDREAVTGWAEGEEMRGEARRPAAAAGSSSARNAHAHATHRALTSMSVSLVLSYTTLEMYAPWLSYLTEFTGFVRVILFVYGTQFGSTSVRESGLFVS